MMLSSGKCGDGNDETQSPVPFSDDDEEASSSGRAEAFKSLKKGIFSPKNVDEQESSKERVALKMTDLTIELGLLARYTGVNLPLGYSKVLTIDVSDSDSESNSTESSAESFAIRKKRQVRAPRIRAHKGRPYTKRERCHRTRILSEAKKNVEAANSSGPGKDDTDSEWTELDDQDKDNLTCSSASSSTSKESLVLEVVMKQLDELEAAKASSKGKFLLPLITDENLRDLDNTQVILHEDIIKFVTDENILSKTKLATWTETPNKESICNKPLEENDANGCVSPDEEAALLQCICDDWADCRGATWKSCGDLLLEMFHWWGDNVIIRKPLFKAVQIDESEWEYDGKYECVCHLCLGLVLSPMNLFIKDLLSNLANSGENSLHDAVTIMRALKLRESRLVLQPKLWDIPTTFPVSNEGAEIIYEKLKELSNISNLSNAIVNTMCACRPLTEGFSKDIAVSRLCSLLENYKTCSICSFTVNTVNMNNIGDGIMFNDSSYKSLSEYLDTYHFIYSPYETETVYSPENYEYQCECLSPKNLFDAKIRALYRMTFVGFFQCANFVYKRSKMAQGLNKFSNNDSSDTVSTFSFFNHLIDFGPVIRSLFRSSNTIVYNDEDVESGPTDESDSSDESDSDEESDEDEAVDDDEDAENTDEDDVSEVSSSDLSSTASLDSASIFLYASTKAIESEPGPAPSEMTRTCKHLRRSITTIEDMLDQILYHCREWPRTGPANVEMGKDIHKYLAIVDRKLTSIYARLPDVYEKQVQLCNNDLSMAMGIRSGKASAFYRPNPAVEQNPAVEPSSMCMQLLSASAPAPPIPRKPILMCSSAGDDEICPEYHYSKMQEVREKVLHIRDQKLYRQQLKNWVIEQHRKIKQRTHAEKPLSMMDLGPRRSRKKANLKLQQLTAAARRKIRSQLAPILGQPSKIISLIGNIQKPNEDVKPPESGDCTRAMAFLNDNGHFGTKTESLFYNLEDRLYKKIMLKSLGSRVEIPTYVYGRVAVYAASDEFHFKNMLKILSRIKKKWYTSRKGGNEIRQTDSDVRMPLLVPREVSKVFIDIGLDSPPAINDIISFCVEMKKVMAECRNLVDECTDVGSGKKCKVLPMSKVTPITKPTNGVADDKDYDVLTEEQVCDIMVNIGKRSMEYLNTLEFPETLFNASQVKMNAEFLKTMPEFIASIPDVATKLTEYASNASSEIWSFMSAIDLPTIDDENKLSDETRRQIRELKLNKKPGKNAKPTKQVCKAMNKLKANIDYAIRCAESAAKKDNFELNALAKGKSKLDVMFRKSKKKNTKVLIEVLQSLASEVVTKSLIDSIENNKYPCLKSSFKEFFALVEEFHAAPEEKIELSIFDSIIKQFSKIELVQNCRTVAGKYCRDRGVVEPADYELAVEQLVDLFLEYVDDLQSTESPEELDEILMKVDNIRYKHLGVTQKPLQKLLYIKSDIDKTIMRLASDPDFEYTAKCPRFQLSGILRCIIGERRFAHWVLSEPVLAFKSIKKLILLPFHHEHSPVLFKTIYDRVEFIQRQVQSINRLYMYSLPKDKLTEKEWLLVLYHLADLETDIKKFFRKLAVEKCDAFTERRRQGTLCNNHQKMRLMSSSNNAGKGSQSYFDENLFKILCEMQRSELIHSKEMLRLEQHKRLEIECFTEELREKARLEDSIMNKHQASQIARAIVNNEHLNIQTQTKGETPNEQKTPIDGNNCVNQKKVQSEKPNEGPKQTQSERQTQKVDDKNLKNIPIDKGHFTECPDDNITFAELMDRHADEFTPMAFSTKKEARKMRQKLNRKQKKENHNPKLPPHEQTVTYANRLQIPDKFLKYYTPEERQAKLEQLKHTGAQIINTVTNPLQPHADMQIETISRITTNCPSKTINYTEAACQTNVTQLKLLKQHFVEDNGSPKPLQAKQRPQDPRGQGRGQVQAQTKKAPGEVSEAEKLAGKGLSKMINNPNILMDQKVEDKDNCTRKCLMNLKNNNKPGDEHQFLQMCEGFLLAIGDKDALDCFMGVKSHILDGLPIPEPFKKHVPSICKKLEKGICSTHRSKAETILNGKQSLIGKFVENTMKKCQNQNDTKAEEVDDKQVKEMENKQCKANDKKPNLKMKHGCRVGHAQGTCPGDGNHHVAGLDQPCTCCYCTVFGQAPPNTVPVSRNYNETRERLLTILNKKKQKSAGPNQPEADNDKRPPSPPATEAQTQPDSPKDDTPTTTVDKQPSSKATSPQQAQSKPDANDAQQALLTEKMAKMAVSDTPQEAGKPQQQQPQDQKPTLLKCAKTNKFFKTKNPVARSVIQQPPPNDVLRVRAEAQTQTPQCVPQPAKGQEQTKGPPQQAQAQSKPQSQSVKSHMQMAAGSLTPMQNQRLMSQQQMAAEGITPQQQQQKLQQQQIQQQKMHQQKIHQQQIQHQKMQQQQMQKEKLQQQKLQKQQREQRSRENNRSVSIASSRDGSCYSGGSCDESIIEDTRDLEALLQYIEGPSRHVDKGKKKAKKQRQKAKKMEVALIEEHSSIMMKLTIAQHMTQQMRTCHAELSRRLESRKQMLLQMQPTKKKGKKQKKENLKQLEISKEQLDELTKGLEESSREIKEAEDKIREYNKVLKGIEEKIEQVQKIRGPHDRPNQEPDEDDLEYQRHRARLLSEQEMIQKHMEQQKKKYKVDVQEARPAPSPVQQVVRNVALPTVSATLEPTADGMIRVTRAPDNSPRIATRVLATPTVEETPPEPKKKSEPKKNSWDAVLQQINDLASDNNAKEKKKKEAQKVEPKPVKPPPPPPEPEPQLSKKQRKLLARQQAEAEEQKRIREEQKKQKKDKQQTNQKPVKHEVKKEAVKKPEPPPKVEKKEEKKKPEIKKGKDAKPARPEPVVVQAKRPPPTQQSKTPASVFNNNNNNIKKKVTVSEKSEKLEIVGKQVNPNSCSLLETKPASCSIMEQLSCGVQVADLKLPPGITLTRVQPNEKKDAPIIKSVPAWKSNCLAAAPTPVAQPPPFINAEPSLMTFSTAHPEPPKLTLPEPISVPMIGKSKKAKKKAKKAAELEQAKAESNQMVTLRNPMFHPNLPQVQVSNNQAKKEPSRSIPDPIPMPPKPCQATITPISNGMFTIRNPYMSLMHQQAIGMPNQGQMFAQPTPQFGPGYQNPNLKFSEKNEYQNQTLKNMAAFTQKSEEGYSLFQTEDYKPDNFFVVDTNNLSNPIGRNGDSLFAHSLEPSKVPEKNEFSGGFYTPFGVEDKFRSALFSDKNEGAPTRVADEITNGDSLPYFQRLRVGAKLNNEVTIHHVNDSKFMNKAPEPPVEITVVPKQEDPFPRSFPSKTWTAGYVTPSPSNSTSSISSNHFMKSSNSSVYDSVSNSSSNSPQGVEVKDEEAGFGAIGSQTRNGVRAPQQFYPDGPSMFADRNVPDTDMALDRDVDHKPFDFYFDAAPSKPNFSYHAISPIKKEK